MNPQPPPTSTDQALAEVAQERDRQRNRWGEQDHSPLEWAAIVAEEAGEVSKAAIEWQHLRTATLIPYRLELIHCAAVCVAALEALNRGQWIPLFSHIDQKENPERSTP